MAVIATLLAFWPFANPWMLLWGLVALAPLILHLWARRRYQEVPWAAMEYLLAAMRKHARRILLEQWLLLAVRVAVVLLFTLALADAGCEPSGMFAAAGGREARHTLLVLDATYSMLAEEQGQTNFARAQQRAVERVAAGAPGDGFTLLLASDPPRSVVPLPAFDHGDLEAEIRGISCTHGTASLPALLRQVGVILSAAAEREPRLQRHEVVFLTDLDQALWRDSNAAALAGVWSDLAERAELHVESIGAQPNENFAVVELAADPTVGITGRNLEAVVTVASYGAAESRVRRVQLLADGRLLEEKLLEIPPGGSASAVFSARLTEVGDRILEARVPEDPLPVDNHRFRVVPMRDSFRVLCVEGSPGEAGYLRHALDPSARAPRAVEVAVAGEASLLERSLAEYDAIFLCNVARVLPEEAAVLNRYVAQGGGLVVFLGDRVQAENYNRQLGRELLPAELGELAAESQYRFDPLEYRHPLLSPFRGHEASGLLDTPVWRYVQLTPKKDPTVATALAFGNGDPAIVAWRPRQRGGTADVLGSVILVATAASNRSVDAAGRPWTEFANWPSFPPLVQEMLRFSLGSLAEDRNTLVGGTLHLPDPPSGVESVLLRDPRGRSLRLRLGNGIEPLDVETAWSGVYELNDEARSLRRFAVNLAPVESDLERVGMAELPPLLRNEEEPTTGEGNVLGGRSESLFRFFLGAVLVLLLVETWLASRQGSSA